MINNDWFSWIMLISISKIIYIFNKLIMLWFPTFLGKPYEEIKSYECTNMRQISTPNTMLTTLVIRLPSVETL